MSPEFAALCSTHEQLSSCDWNCSKFAVSTDIIYETHLNHTHTHITHHNSTIHCVPQNTIECHCYSAPLCCSTHYSICMCIAYMHRSITITQITTTKPIRPCLVHPPHCEWEAMCLVPTASSSQLPFSHSSSTTHFCPNFAAKKFFFLHPSNRRRKTNNLNPNSSPTKSIKTFSVVEWKKTYWRNFLIFLRQNSFVSAIESLIENTSIYVCSIYKCAIECFITVQELIFLFEIFFCFHVFFRIESIVVCVSVRCLY